MHVHSSATETGCGSPTATSFSTTYEMRAMQRGEECASSHVTMRHWCWKLPACAASSSRRAFTSQISRACSASDPSSTPHALLYTSCTPQHSLVDHVRLILLHHKIDGCKKATERKIQEAGNPPWPCGDTASTTLHAAAFLTCIPTLVGTHTPPILLNMPHSTDALRQRGLGDCQRACVSSELQTTQA